MDAKTVVMIVSALLAIPGCVLIISQFDIFAFAEPVLFMRPQNRLLLGAGLIAASFLVSLVGHAVL